MLDPCAGDGAVALGWAGHNLSDVLTIIGFGAFGGFHNWWFQEGFPINLDGIVWKHFPGCPTWKRGALGSSFTQE